jgi:hypothetical protein
MSKLIELTPLEFQCSMSMACPGVWRSEDGKTYQIRGLKVCPTIGTDDSYATIAGREETIEISSDLLLSALGGERGEGKPAEAGRAVVNEAAEDASSPSGLPSLLQAEQVEQIVSRLETVGPRWLTSPPKPYHARLIAMDYERGAEAIRALQSLYGPQDAPRQPQSTSELRTDVPTLPPASGEPREE